jgi:GTP-binding protein
MPTRTAAQAHRTVAGLPTLAIVGRPNVGKSTLLNRIVGRREAIVEERPGVTRDRKIVEAEWQGRDFTVVDTGGWMPGGSSLDEKVSRQAERAMADADAVLFVVDSRTGPTDEDTGVAALLRRLDKPVFVVVNKVDHATRAAETWEFVSLGLGDPFPVSALHGLGTGDLLDAALAALPAADVPGHRPARERSTVDALPSGALTQKARLADLADLRDGDLRDGDLRDGDVGEDDLEASNDFDIFDASDASDASVAADTGRELFSVAIVGRPNVGKSTLFNRLIGDDRSVVHDLPGTTRDAVDTVVDTPFGPVRFVDTAGMRRRSRIDEVTEYFSMVRALKAVDKADVAMLVIDATQGITHQDQRLGERVDAAGCPVVIVLNKIELLDAEGRADIGRQVSDRLRFLGQAPVLKISALSGKGVQKLLPSLGDTISDYHARVPTATVNRVIREAQAAQPAPHGSRVLYATQGATDPPTFTLFTNRELPPTYLRYLERRLREACDLGSTPIKLRVRRRS